MQSPYQDPGDGYGGGAQVRLAMPALTGVVKKLLIANVAVYAAMFILYLISEPAVAFVLDWLGIAPSLWWAHFPLLPIWQLGTYGFVHSIGPGHLLMNMLLLYFFGTMLEGMLGGRRFLVVYLSALVAGAALHLLGEAALGQSHPAIGASGAVLGVLIATAVLRPDTQVLFFFFPVRLKYLAAGIVILDFINLAIGLKSGRGDSVAHFVHLGGAFYGFLAARLGWIWWDPVQRLEARRAVSRESTRIEGERTMDALLEKIHKQGLGSLSESEKKFLQNASRHKRD